jgi:hypothetical protein
MSFFGIVKQDIAGLDADALAAAKVGLNYIDGVVTQDILPVLETQLLAAIEKLGQEAVAALLGDALGNAASPVTPPVTSAS